MIDRFTHLFKARSKEKTLLSKAKTLFSGREEVNIKIKLEKLLIVFTVRKKNLIQFVFLAKHLNKTFKPGIETLEVKYFDYKDIPWKLLAFPSVTYALKKIGKFPKNLPIFHTFNKD